MSPSKTTVGVLPLVMAILAAVSTTFAIVTGLELKRVESLEIKVQTQEVNWGIINTKVDNLLKSNARMEDLLTAHIGGKK